MKPSLVIRSFTMALALLSSMPLLAATLFPGRIRNPPGLQMNMDVRYNPVRDQYLLAYTDGRALVGHVSPAGVFSGEIVISANTGATNAVLAYNSVQDTFLLVWRNDSPTEIYARYLNSDGTPIGNQFLIGSGAAPHVDFSPASERYVITWSNPTVDVVYKVVDGDATSATPIIRSGVISSNAHSDQVVYGSVSNKFLVVYVIDFAPNPRRSDVFGRFLSSDGTNLGPQFSIDTDNEDQQKPVLAYAASHDRWMTSYEAWDGCGGGCPNARAALINAAGALTNEFNVAATSGWDVPGAITYNDVTKTFIAAWRSSGSTERAYARSFSPATGIPIGGPVLLSDVNPGPRSAASRPDDVDPQALVLWREGAGLDGIYAGIVHLVPPVPDTTPPAAIANLQGTASAQGLLAPAIAIDSSGSDSSANGIANLTDGNPATYWSSPGRASLHTEFVTFDLGTQKTVTSVRLLSRNTGNLFPLDYQIQVSDNNVNFTTVLSVTNATAAPSTWVEHSIPSGIGRYLRLLITRPRKSAVGQYKAQIAEFEIFEETALGGAVQLSWTAPGDDGNTGTAAAYDLRWSLSNITPANFTGATRVTIPSPKTAGSVETAGIGGLPNETAVFVAIKSRDEASNLSEISNVISVNTPGVAPAAIANLATSNPTATSIRLNWTAVGDDGAAGTADEYDLRVSTSPIDGSNFDAATPVLGAPSPAASGTPQNFTVPGLNGETTYFFAMKVKDELGNTSGINTNGPVSGTTLDIVAPSGVTDLTAAPGAGNATKLVAPAIASSGDYSSSVSKGKATDGNASSHWSSPIRTARMNEFITVDTRSINSIGRVRLLSRNSANLFPEDLQIQVSNDNVNFATVHASTGLPSTISTWHAFDFSSASGRYVRVLITKTRRSADGYVAQIAEVEVYQVSPANGTMNLTWTAPGDSGNVGTAVEYDLRWSLNPITGVNFGSASPVTTGAPKIAGSLEMVTAGGLPDESTLFFALKAADDSGNTSVLSNVASGTTPGVAPAAIDDLAASNPTASSIHLTWTAVGDDGNGGGAADSYDLRRSTSPIDGSNFSTATPVGGVSSPGAPGAPQSFTVSGLTSDTTYYFAIRVKDELGNTSASNTNGPVSGKTLDATAPAVINDLAASPASAADIKLVAPAIASSGDSSSSVGKAKSTDGDGTTHWSSPGRVVMQNEYITTDTGSIHDISQVRLLSRNSAFLFPVDVQIQVSNDNSNFVTVHTATGLPATPATLTTLDFPSSPGRYVRVLMTKTRLSGGGLYMAQLAEIEVYEAGVNDRIALAWTATGDDGIVGTATSYDLRRSTSPIDAANFGTATPVAGVPAPQAAGGAESFTVTGLGPGTYYFAIKAEDDSGNVSVISNVPSATLP